MLSDAILKGLRVIEASAFVAAPLGGMTLAQLGAEVIRIDPIAGGLDYKRWPVSENNTSLFWCGLNKSKKSVAIDMASPEGRELAAALITAPGPDAGLLLTNFPPRGFLDYDVLKKQRPDLIQLTISGDRHGGSAVDYTINPRLGIPFLTGGGEDTEVWNHVLPAWDLVTGNMAVIGILAAERLRRQTGQGQHIKLALEDAALAVMGHLGFIAEAQLGATRQRISNDLFGAFGRDFKTADGERIMIVGLTLKQWHSLCRATDLQKSMGELEKTLNINLDDEGNRFRAREAIAGLLKPWVGARTMAQIAQAFDKTGVCWSKYQTVQQLVVSDPACSTANPLFAQLEQQGVGNWLVPGLPLNFSGVERAPAKPAPQLGEHTEEVLSQLLGLGSAELGRMFDRGLIGAPSSKTASVKA
jgi:2-methylfumaryl-CoA isomerase